MALHDQALLLRTLSDFTRVLLTPYDVRAALSELADRLTDILDLLGSGVSLLEGDRLSFETSYGPAVASVEKTQDHLQAGPCVEAVSAGTTVVVRDLGELESRWPAYVDEARRLGIDSVASIPMKLDHRTVGVIDLYARGQRDWTDEDLAVARVMADMATAYLINASHHEKEAKLTRELQGALDSRVVIEQAKGMVAARQHVSMSTAFDRLRRYARQRGVPIRSVAEAVVNLGLDV